MVWRAPGIAWLLVGFCLAGPSAWAQSRGSDGAGPRAPAEETGPSMEFLEYLGTWESGDGEWIDPTDVQAVDWPETGREAAAQESDHAN